MIKRMRTKEQRSPEIGGDIPRIGMSDGPMEDRSLFCGENKEAETADEKGKI